MLNTKHSVLLNDQWFLKLVSMTQSMLDNFTPLHWSVRHLVVCVSDRDAAVNHQLIEVGYVLKHLVLTW